MLRNFSSEECRARAPSVDEQCRASSLWVRRTPEVIKMYSAKGQLSPPPHGCGFTHHFTPHTCRQLTHPMLTFLLSTEQLHDRCVLTASFSAAGYTYISRLVSLEVDSSDLPTMLEEDRIARTTHPKNTVQTALQLGPPCPPGWATLGHLQ